MSFRSWNVFIFYEFLAVSVPYCVSIRLSLILLSFSACCGHDMHMTSIHFCDIKVEYLSRGSPRTRISLERMSPRLPSPHHHSHVHAHTHNPEPDLNTFKEALGISGLYFGFFCLLVGLYEIFLFVLT